MARPKRYNVDYFPHYISDGKKMFVIESKYGNDGYATWFKILESLAKTDNHFINCNDETNLMYLAAKCRISVDTLKCIILDLCKLGELDIILWEQSSVIWSDKFIESILDAYSKRSNDCITKMQLLTDFKRLRIPIPQDNGVYVTVNPVNSPVKPQSKVDYTKLDQSKVDNIPSLQDFISYGLEQSSKNNINVTETALSMKYEAWKLNGWVNGNGNKIKNWKSSLINTLPYIKETVNGKPVKPETPKERDARIFMETVKAYNTHKTLYGEESANEKFKFNEHVQSNNNNNRIA